MTSEASAIPAYEGWAVIEIMGHKKLAGYVREAPQYGTAMLRVDVFGDGEKPTATQFYGGSSIYCVTPCSEEIARSLTKRATETPEAVAYALPAPRRCDHSWGRTTPCSPDFTVPDAEERTSICGRHQLEDELEDRTPEPDEADGIADLQRQAGADVDAPVPPDFEMDPRD